MQAAFQTASILTYQGIKIDSFIMNACMTNLIIPISASLSRIALARASPGSGVLLKITWIFIRELTVKAILSRCALTMLLAALTFKGGLSWERKRGLHLQQERQTILKCGNGMALQLGLAGVGGQPAMLALHALRGTRFQIVRIMTHLHVGDSMQHNAGYTSVALER